MPLQIRARAEVHWNCRLEQVEHLAGNGIADRTLARLDLLHIRGNQALGVVTENDTLHVPQVAHGDIPVRRNGEIFHDPPAQGFKKAVLYQTTANETHHRTG